MIIHIIKESGVWESPYWVCQFWFNWFEIARNGYHVSFTKLSCKLELPSWDCLALLWLLWSERHGCRGHRK